jgi:imidazolonepropionase
VAFDLLLTNACVATMNGAQPFGLVRDGAVGVTKGKVAWIGRVADVPAGGAGETWNIGGKVPTSGLVDPHTHIVEGLVDFEDLEGRGGGVGALNPPRHPDGYACQVRTVKCGAFGMLA